MLFASRIAPGASLACLLPVLLALLTTGCAAWYAARADAEVDALIAQRTDEVIGARAVTAVPSAPPESAPAQPEPAPAPAEAPPPAEPPPSAQHLELRDALRIAVSSNRDFLTRRESLYLQGLSTTLARFTFGPQLRAALNAVYATIEGGNEDPDLVGTFGASQILPTGGTVSVSNDLVARNLAKTFEVTVDQPLLRGFGYEASHEALTQAERNLVYEIRAFELFRQDFTIAIARSFFALVTQKRTLANEVENHRQAVFDREQADALFGVGRNDEQDVFRARRREIEAHDTLIDARASYRRALDDFKIALGMPTTSEIEIADHDPPFEAVRMDVTAAVSAALNNRLDLMTQRDSIEDADRVARIAANSLLPDFDLQLRADHDDALGTDGDGIWSGSANLSLELPLQRTPERNAYRAALIALERAQRELSLQVDRLELDIRDALRQLDSLEQRIGLQREQIEQQKRAVTVSVFRYESGELENRDLLDARQSLVDAQNSLIQLLAEHFVQRLQLLRDLGLLFVDANGEWR